MEAYCFLGGILFDNHYDEIANASKSGLQNAPSAFQLAMIDGLRNNLPSLDVINLPFIGSYPINYNRIYSPSSNSFTYQNSNGLDINCSNVRFLNLTYFKLYTRENAVYRELERQYKDLSEENYLNIFVYTVHIPFLKAAIRFRKKHKYVRIILIITDLPEFKNDDMAVWKKVILSYDCNVGEELYNAVDGFILLTEYMVDRVVFRNQPYVVIEGLFSKCEVGKVHLSESKEKTVFYSGTLARRYNIMSLVEAFRNLKTPDTKLVICGEGACKDEIVQASLEDPRIVYKGELNRKEVLELQRNATLLVNPRKNESEFTKFSFPSKNMEYMTSGVPALIYKLDGIPEEYYDYCYTLEDSSTEALTKKMEEILDRPEQERKDLAKRALSFVLEFKNANVQTAKVKDLLQRLKYNR